VADLDVVAEQRDRGGASFSASRTTGRRAAEDRGDAVLTAV
jgi:hypothetical protein